VSTEIRVGTSPGEVQVAALRDGLLIDYAVWRPGAPDGVGDLHRGRLATRVPAMAGAFITLDGAEGFLPDSEGGAGRGPGDTLLVRVTRAAAGGKGPRVTARLSTAEKALAGGGPPALVRRGPSAILRIAELYANAPLLVDDTKLVAELRAVFADRVTTTSGVLTTELEADIAALAEPIVVLPNGARLAIEPTRALVAVDVDTASATTSRQTKRIAQRKLNLALLPELARQIRLRELGGPILVDFAGLGTKDRAGLAPALAAALTSDPACPRLLGFTPLGLAEILRPRIHAPLHEMLAGPHAAGLRALRRLDREVAAAPQRHLALRAAPNVVTALQVDPVALPDLARRSGRPLILRSDPVLPPDTWVIEHVGT
jgi:Ribonuclease G/E